MDASCTFRGTLVVQSVLPNVGWDKGKAVRYLCQALHVDSEEFVPLYLGDPEQAGRTTAADFVLESVGEVQRFLNTRALIAAPLIDERSTATRETVTM
jgi:hypothetical protein